jgi:hypothetical protein
MGSPRLPRGPGSSHGGKFGVTTGFHNGAETPGVGKMGKSNQNLEPCDNDEHFLHKTEFCLSLCNKGNLFCQCWGGRQTDLLLDKQKLKIPVITRLVS